MCTQLWECFNNVPFKKIAYKCLIVFVQQFMLDFKHTAQGTNPMSEEYELSPLLMESYQFETSWRYILPVRVCVRLMLRLSAVL